MVLAYGLGFLEGKSGGMEEKKEKEKQLLQPDKRSYSFFS